VKKQLVYVTTFVRASARRNMFTLTVVAVQDDDAPPPSAGVDKSARAVLLFEEQLVLKILGLVLLALF